MRDTNIIQQLQSLYQLYVTLYTLEKQKTEALISRKIEELEKITQQQEKINILISQEENLLFKIFKETITSKEEETLNLSNFLHQHNLEASTKEKVLELKQEIKDIVNKLQDKIKSNNLLLKDSLHFFKEFIKHITTEGDATYHINKNNDRAEIPHAKNIKPIFLNTVS